MVIAALVSFGVLFIAWMLAPSGPSTGPDARIEREVATAAA